MGTLTAVHHFEPESWRLAPGWLNSTLIVAARRVRLDLSTGLCPRCCAKAGSLPLLAVKMFDGSRYLVLGDGRSPDASAVLAARLLCKARRRCEVEQHLGGPGSFTTGTDAES